jgi:TRAP-type C4-dicarboxylate transport system permease small subunit
VKEAIKRIRDVLHAISGCIAVISVILLTVINFIGIISRFVFNYPLEWTFELSILCFSWVIFLGVGMAFKNSDHMALTFISFNLPEKTQYYWRQAIHILCMLFLIIAFVEGLRITGATWGQTYNTIPVSKGLFYCSLPAGSLAGFFNLLYILLDFTISTKDSKSGEGA